LAFSNSDTNSDISGTGMNTKKYSKTCVPSLSRSHKRYNKRLANKRLRKQWAANAEYKDEQETEEST
jgi:hypothetical protein